MKKNTRIHLHNFFLVFGIGCLYAIVGVLFIFLVTSCNNKTPVNPCFNMPYGTEVTGTDHYLECKGTVGKKVGWRLVEVSFSCPKKRYPKVFYQNWEYEWIGSLTLSCRDLLQINLKDKK